MDQEYLKRLGLSIARGVPQMATGFVDLAALPFTMTGLLEPEQAFGSTAYLTSKGLLPPEQTGLLNETTELVSSALNPAGALKGGLLALGAMAGVKGGAKLPVDDLVLESKRLRAIYQKNPSQENLQKYLDVNEQAQMARDQRAVGRAEARLPVEVVEAVDGYKMMHTAPTRASGAPLSALDQVYPNDVYSKNAVQFYGVGDTARDRAIFAKAQALRNKPDAEVVVYRAVPKDLPSNVAINPGDWVTIDKQYAVDHGKGVLNGEYKIIKKKVKAGDIFTNADSIYEFGYDPFK
jgi:hypothetical protein